MIPIFTVAMIFATPFNTVDFKPKLVRYNAYREKRQRDYTLSRAFDAQRSVTSLNLPSFNS